MSNYLFFGVFISLAFYAFGLFLAKKWKIAIVNPLLIAIVLTICFLLIFKIDYQDYASSAKYLSYLLTPATVALAIPLYEQLKILKDNFKAIIVTTLVGTITSMITILIIAVSLGLTHNEYVTFLPKSITTAIGMELSGELGGYVNITVVTIILTGVFGQIVADSLFKIFRVEDSITKGLALGIASHAAGTAKAAEIGSLESAVSSVALILSGILTVILINVFVLFY